MNALDRLNDWKKKSSGEFTTHCTITLKTSSMNITVTGSDLEDAYKQLESVCFVEPTQPKEEVNVTSQNTFQPSGITQLNTPIQNLGKPKTLTDMLQGKQLLRIHGSEPLNPGEELIPFGGVNYVVKGE